MGRSPMCKTCVSYTPNADGTIVCEYSGAVIDANSKPLYQNEKDGPCYERRPKKKVSPTELSKIRSAAGKKGGMKKRGRTPKSQMQINKIDFLVFSEYARRVEKDTIVRTFHNRITKKILLTHPELKPPGWVD